MDIHRCRFVPYRPSAINTVAFSNSRTTSAKDSAVTRLAVGRANGDIEIWNPANGSWLQEIVIRGGRDRSVDSLVWVTEADQDLGDGHVIFGKPRLFSIGYTSTVTEWDLEKGKPKRHASGQHGDIWCIAAQPPGEPGTLQAAPSANKLIVGTIDGELAMYSIEDEDLRFQRIIVKAHTRKAQMVSITFQSRQVVVVGCSDSTIRAYDIKKGHMLRKMALGADVSGGSKDIIAWSVKCLPNGNIVSGDSTGQVCIWDGKTYTQSQRLHSHKSDVLSLATSADGTAITSGGMDRRTILYKQNPDSGQRWVKVWGRRYHKHDVKTMAAFEYGRMSVVVSGGPDTNLTIVPLKEMGRENHRLISGLPQQPPIMSSAKARFVVSWWEREIRVWILRKSAADLQVLTDEHVDIDHNRKLLKTIVVKGDSNISSAAINQEGTILFVSTSADIKAFRLVHQDPRKPSDLWITSIELPPRLSRLGATHVKLSPDGCWLFVVQEGSHSLIAGVSQTEDEDTAIAVKVQRLFRLRRSIPKHISNGGLGGYNRTISQIAFSADSRLVAVADLAGYIDTWILRDQPRTLRNGQATDDAASNASDNESSSSEDDESMTASGLRWFRNPNAKLIPKLPTSPLVLSFAGHVPGENTTWTENEPDDYVLVTITSSWNILAFHPSVGTLTRWSRRHPRKVLPTPVQDLMDMPKGIFWQGSRMWVYGVSFLLMIDLAAETSESLGAGANESHQRTKRKRVGPGSGAGGKMREELIPRQARRRGINDQWENVDMVDYPQADDSNSDDDMRDGPEEQSQSMSICSGDHTAASTTIVTTGGPKRWWITYKYRPILGIVPFSSSCQDPEIAIVERPTWDIDVAEKYFKEEEWEN